MKSESRGPDAAELATQSLAAAPFPGRPATALRVHFERAVYRAVTDHAAESKSVEVCGVLVGHWKRDDGGPYVDVCASIRGDAATSKFAEVTFTHETWAKINARMDSEFRDHFIVGWYHTHPDFGVFLSDRDLFIHQHFFSAPGQIALVIDPVRREEGVFVWSEGKAQLAPVHWIGPAPHWSPRSADQQKESRVSADAGRAAGERTRAVPADDAAPFLRSGWTLGLLAVLLFTAGYMFSTWNLASDRQNERRLMVEGLAQELFARSSSLEAYQGLREIKRGLQLIAEQARPPAAADGKPAAAPDYPKVLAAIMDHVIRTDRVVDQTDQVLRFRPEQLAALDLLLAERARAVEQEQAIRRARDAASSKPATAESSAPAEGKN